MDPTGLVLGDDEAKAGERVEVAARGELKAVETKVLAEKAPELALQECLNVRG